MQKTVDDLLKNDTKLSIEMRELLGAYTNGINDFLDGVGYFHDEISAFYLPPEFRFKEIESIEKWTEEDSLLILVFIDFKFFMNDAFSKMDNELKQKCGSFSMKRIEPDLSDYFC